VVRTNTEKQSEKDLKRREKMTKIVNKTVKHINAPNICGAVVTGYFTFVVVSMFNV
tara:strand:- start:186 stop:353 length:168 start_codon:yes stop_codon:yes gene_type:complete